MKTDKTLIWLASLIVLLALVAAGLGVFWQGEGQPFEFRTLMGEAVMIQGRGLYRYDTVSNAAQGIAFDVVTLLVGLPLLVTGLLTFQKSTRGQLLLTGTLAYFLYTYASYAFGGAFYNVLFLVYVALFSLSLSALILSLMQIDVAALPAHFSPRLPRRAIAVFLFVVGGFLLSAWLGRIVPALLAGKPPIGLDSYATLVIQTLDLGLIVPAAFLAGVLLWKQSAWGYLLTSIVLIKAFTLSIAVSAMIVNMMWAGVSVSAGELLMFPLLTLIGAGMMVMLLRNITELARGSA